jgi:hypothetical protein
MYDRVIWPEKYDPKTSAIYALNDIDVKAPPEVVWRLLVDAENWSSYFPPEDQIKILSGERELGRGTPADNGCHVLTEETQQGPWFLEELGRKRPGALYRYHQEWVERLARAAEAEVAVKAR